MDREIKFGAKLEKRLLYLGFEEKNLNIKGLPLFQIKKRYFVSKEGIQIKLNMKDKDITILDKYGNFIDRESSFKSSFIKNIMKKES